MPILLVVANEKGGCGKTTTAMNLAGGFVVAGYKVLVVDADPQRSSIAWAQAAGSLTLPFGVVPSHLLTVPGSYGDGWPGDAYADVVPKLDIILVDCPSGIVTSGLEDTSRRYARAAIRHADALLVPLQPSTLDFSAACHFVRYLAEGALEPGRRVLVFLNGRKNTLLSREAQAYAAGLFSVLPGAQVLESSISSRVSIAEVPGSGQTIFTYAPGSPSAFEYYRLTKEIIQCLAAAPPSSPSSPTPQPQI